jgi:hypothetical protein
MPSQVNIFCSDPDWNRGLPGIDHSHTSLRMPYSSGAPKEYADNEGWQVVRRKGKKYNRFQKRKAETEAAINATAD